MLLDRESCNRAVESADARFDGVFFVGITTTTIYCRPICPARRTLRKNRRYFNSAAAAERAGFRPCLRCRPELAPGRARIDAVPRLAEAAAQRIAAGALNGRGLEGLATDLGVSGRQLRRAMQQELGVSPIELVLTRRLLLAKQLLTETALPIIDVAYASGFSSVRRFNDAFSNRYGMPPSRFRKATDGAAVVTTALNSFTLQLTYRPPFDWLGILQFLGARAMKGVELVREDAYYRTVRLGNHMGWVHVRHAPKNRALLVELTHSLTPVLPVLLGRLRHLFDLSARPDIITGQLAQDFLLAESVAQNPGLRVPGAFDGFELVVRAILGQQITVKAATTLAGRFADAFGDAIDTPHPGLTRLSPTPKRIASAKPEEIAALGVTQARARSIVVLAEEMHSGHLKLEAGAPAEPTIEQLIALPGIGPWTAQYIAMRALRWPDAFPKEDIALRKKLGGVSAARAEELSQAWRPWRSYATLHLWHALARQESASA